MSFQERYRAAFSRVRPAGGFCPEEWTARRPRRRGVPRRALVLAAAVALLAALSLTAYATGIFGLRQWLLPEPVVLFRCGNYHYLLYVYYFQRVFWTFLAVCRCPYSQGCHDCQ